MGSPPRAPVAAAVRHRAPRATLCLRARGRRRCHAVRGHRGLFCGSQQRPGASFQEGLGVGGVELKGFVMETCGVWAQRERTGGMAACAWLGCVHTRV